MHDKQSLKKSLGALGIEATDIQLQLSLDYLAVLKKWNTVHNLTRIDAHKQFDLHIVDSLSIHRLCQGSHILDVGSGAGLPGIPLSIFFPEKKFYLLDSNQKKSIFTKYAASKLGLSNVISVHSRVEEYKSEHQFQTILSRAFASTNKFINSCGHLLAKDGKLIAMKGQISEEPENDLPLGFHLEACIPLVVPGVESRHAAIICRAEES
tara:strand:- start:3272 stop:3898 length:627 start_codon:yes stop_codon:yes gene_type:complete